jgi:predicted DNA-binding transcriptional regulator YafY
MRNPKLRKEMAKVPQEIKKQVEQAVLDLEDMRTWRYEYYNYRHVLRLHVDGKPHTVTIDIPYHDEEEKKQFWATMVGRGLSLDEIEKAEKSIVEKDKLPF